MSACQLQIASQLGMGVVSISSSQHWTPLWLEPVQALCMLSWSLWVHMCVSMWKVMLPWYLPYPLGVTILLPFLQSILSLGGKDLTETSHLRLTIPMSFSLWTLSSCVSLKKAESSLMIPEQNIEGFLEQNLARSYFISVFLRSTIVFGISLGP